MCQQTEFIEVTNIEEDSNNKLHQKACSSWHFNVHLRQKMQQNSFVHNAILQSSITYSTFQVIEVRYFWLGFFLHITTLHVHTDFLQDLVLNIL